MDGSPSAANLDQVRTTLLGALLAASALGGAAACGAGYEGKTTVLSLDNLASGDAGGALARALAHEPGVRRATFAVRKAELSVVAEPGVDVMAAANRLKREGDYDVVEGSGHGRYHAWGPPPEGVDVAVVSENGVDVADLGPHKVIGKVTVMDFSAKWCEPCRMLDAHLTSLAGRRGDVAYRKLDVGDWDTPLAVHYMKNVPQLPYVIVFDKQGKEVDRVTGLDTDRIDEDIERASR